MLSKFICLIFEDHRRQIWYITFFLLHKVLIPNNLVINNMLPKSSLEKYLHQNYWLLEFFLAYVSLQFSIEESSTKWHFAIGIFYSIPIIIHIIFTYRASKYSSSTHHTSAVIRMLITLALLTVRNSHFSSISIAAIKLISYPLRALLQYNLHHLSFLQSSTRLLGKLGSNLLVCRPSIFFITISANVCVKSDARGRNT